MSKLKKLTKKFTNFVNQLSPDEVREQLVLSYLQMHRCMQVLRGHDVEPVEMKDNSQSSDLELFYLCKKVAEENAYLNRIASKPDDVEDLFFDPNNFDLFEHLMKERVRELVKQNESRCRQLLAIEIAKQPRCFLVEV